MGTARADRSEPAARGGSSSGPKSNKRRVYSPALKARVAQEAIKGQRSINEIASAYQVHPSLVAQWKKQALEGLPQLFTDGRSREGRAEEQLQEQLYEQIGRLKMELEWLKKKTGGWP